MPLQTEVWVRDIAEKLFPENSFVRRSRNDDAFVSDRIVHRPQSGTLPTVERNRVTLPAPIVQRTDTVNDYQMQEFTSTPTLITNIEEVEVSYAKRQSVLRDHTRSLDRDLATYAMYSWAPSTAGAIVNTTGAVRSAGAPGATGTRKALTLADIQQAKLKLDKQDIPAMGRYMLLTPEMLNDLLNDPKLTSRDYQPTENLVNGTIARILGFDIYVRSLTVRYATGATVAKDPVAANAATDNACGLVWHEDCVATALGAIKVFADEDKPEYYGSIFSTLARAGGQKYYADGTGVVALVEVP